MSKILMGFGLLLVCISICLFPIKKVAFETRFVMALFIQTIALTCFGLSTPPESDFFRMFVTFGLIWGSSTIGFLLFFLKNASKNNKS